jgi:hypothetical protein
MPLTNGGTVATAHRKKSADRSRRLPSSPTHALNSAPRRLSTCGELGKPHEGCVWHFVGSDQLRVNTKTHPYRRPSFFLRTQANQASPIINSVSSVNMDLWILKKSSSPASSPYPYIHNIQRNGTRETIEKTKSRGNSDIARPRGPRISLSCAYPPAPGNRSGSLAARPTPPSIRPRLTLNAPFKNERP